MNGSIEELCRDPYAMRRRADRGLDTPCHRCLFFEPGIGRQCKAVRLAMKPRGPRTVDPRRGPEQQGMFPVLPTPDMMVGPGPEQEDT